MRVLVTGADGFIGARIAAGLAAQGHDVFGAVFTRPAGAREVRIDLTREAELVALPHDVEAVVHTSGIVDPKVDTATIFAVNVEGTRHVTRWAKARGVRHFVQLSSVAVYGPQTVGEERREDTPRLGLVAGLPYMRSKARAERVVEASGLAYTLVRPPAVLGRGDAVSHGIAAAFAGPGIPLVPGARLDRRISVCVVEGLVDLVARLLDRGPLMGPIHAIDAELTLDALLMLYARALRREIRTGPVSWLSVLRNVDDAGFAWLVASARFGQHYSAEHLRRTLPGRPQPSLDAAIQAAVSGLQGNKPGLS